MIKFWTVIHSLSPVLCFIVMSISLTGCSSMRAAPAESSPFLENEQLLKPNNQHIPWDAAWELDPAHVLVKTDAMRTIYIAPVNTEYLNMTKNSQGVETVQEKLSDDTVKPIAELIQTSFKNAIDKGTDPNLRTVEHAGEASLIFETALVELVPTKVGINALVDVGGVLVPGGKAIEEAAVAGTQAAGGAFASGSVAIEGKFRDAQTGKIVAEFKDRESDPASIIPNYRDFEEFGWSRRTIEEWSEELAQVLNTPVDQKTEEVSVMSILPW